MLIRHLPIYIGSNKEILNLTNIENHQTEKIGLRFWTNATVRKRGWNSILCRRFGRCVCVCVWGGVWKSTSTKYIVDTSSVYEMIRVKLTELNKLRKKFRQKTILHFLGKCFWVFYVCMCFISPTCWRVFSECFIIHSNINTDGNHVVRCLWIYIS